jgi:hypothetical protein
MRPGGHRILARHSTLAPMERARWTRLRWRLRGAWLWPAFGTLTLAEGVLLNELPVWGLGPRGFVPGVLIAGFLNLIAIAAGSSPGGRLLRRRRPDLPRPIAADYAGTALLAALAVALLVAGIANHSDVAAEREARVRQLAAVARYVDTQAPEYHARLAQADTMRLEPDVYRTCVPGSDPKRWLCVFVDTRQHPPGITRDPDAAPNGVYQQHGGFD